MRFSALPLVIAAPLFIGVLSGCGATDDAAASTPEQRKSFAGGPPSADSIKRAEAAFAASHKPAAPLPPAAK